MIRIVRYMAIFEKPHRAIVDQLAPIGPFVGLMLQSTWAELNKYGFMSGDQLRKDALLQLTSTMKSVTPEDIVSIHESDCNDTE